MSNALPTTTQTSLAVEDYEPVEDDPNMLWVMERWHYDGQVRRSGRTPRPGIPWGLRGEPAPELIPVGTVVQH